MVHAVMERICLKVLVSEDGLNSRVFTESIIPSGGLGRVILASAVLPRVVV